MNQPKNEVAVIFGALISFVSPGIIKLKQFYKGDSCPDYRSIKIVNRDDTQDLEETGADDNIAR